MPQVPPPRVQLFHARAEEAGPLIARLRAAGYEPLQNPEPGSPSARKIAESGVVAVVIDLSRLPSQGRYVAAWLRHSKITRHLPLVFVGGEADKVEMIQRQIPDAVYVSPREIGAALRKAIQHPPR